MGRIGYTGVELAGHRDFNLDALKAAVTGAGLKVSGMHMSYAQLDADLNAAISDALHFGTKHVVCSWWPYSHFTSAAACQNIGEKLGAIGAGLRAFGLQFSFHNHAREFNVIEGRTVMTGFSPPRPPAPRRPTRRLLGVQGRLLARPLPARAGDALSADPPEGRAGTGFRSRELPRGVRRGGGGRRGRMVHRRTGTLDAPAPRGRARLLRAAPALGQGLTLERMSSAPDLPPVPPALPAAVPPGGEPDGPPFGPGVETAERVAVDADPAPVRGTGWLWDLSTC
ncbi:MAG: hypothetical protein WDM96_04685 [Lacunisphaera sp.]